MNIYFYKLNNREKSVNKTATLSSTGLTIQGTMRSGSSIINPVITFNVNYTAFKSYNYVYIPDFERYYFIDNVVMERSDLSTIFLKVDVLTSFLKSNYSCEGYVARSSNSTIYNLNIQDDRIQLSNIPSVSEQKVLHATGYADYINTVFTTECTNNVVINMINGVVTESGFNYTNDTITIPSFLGFGEGDFYNTADNTNGYLKDYKLRVCTGSYYYVTDSSNLSSFYLALMGDHGEEIRSCVKSMIAYPFDLLYSGSQVRMKYGGTNTEVVPITLAYGTPYGRARFLITEYFKVENHNLNGTRFTDTFLKSNNHLRIELYIPYYGWINVGAESYGHTFIIYYATDFSSGAADVFVYDKTYKKHVFQGSCQLGIKLSITESNQQEIKAREQANNLNMGIGMLAAAAQIGIGVSTNNPYAIGRGVTGAAVSISNYISNKALLFVQANATVGDSSTGIFGPQRARLRFTWCPYTQDMTDTLYKQNVGIPVNKVVTLDSTLIGSSENYYEIVDMHTESLFNTTSITKMEDDELKKLCAEGIHW